MLDRLRCPICRSVVPITLVWALGDSCPRCSEPLRAAALIPAEIDEREAALWR